MSTDIVKAVKAMTDAANDRTRFPLMVMCRRTPGPFPGCCVGHADCRVKHWERHDAELTRLAVRGFPVKRKSRANA